MNFEGSPRKKSRAEAHEKNLRIEVERPACGRSQAAAPLKAYKALFGFIKAYKGL
jgi:hypothetical protein